jgi:hypothetical protein
MSRVIFIPWSGEEAEEFLELSNQWNTALEGSGKRFTIVTYQAGLAPEDQPLKDLVEGQVYMRGHGMPGSPFVTSRGKSLHIRDSIARVTEMGLKPPFRGKIKFYSCFSGLDGVPKMRRELVTLPKVSIGTLSFGSKRRFRDVDKGLFEGTYDSLATRGAEIFRARGFDRCTFYGYGGPLTSEMVVREEDKLADGHVHKYCLTVTFDGYGNPVCGSGPDSTGRRASSARAQF